MSTDSESETVHEPHTEYADLMDRYFRGELEPGPSILDIKVDDMAAQEIRQELHKEYGTDDPVKIIDVMRIR